MSSQIVNYPISLDGSGARAGRVHELVGCMSWSGARAGRVQARIKEKDENKKSRAEQAKVFIIHYLYGIT